MGLVWALVLLSSEPVSAQVLTRAPELIEFVEAAYPEEAKAEGLTGEVLLEVDIDEDGSVMDARVLEGAGHGFDEAAVAAVLQFRFHPAEIDDQPSPVTIEYRYHFQLRPEAHQPEVTEEEKPGIVNLRGVVVQRGTRRPIAGATVDVADGAAIATTDEEGRFEATDVPVGEVTVVVIDSAHERFESQEIVEEGKVTEVTYYVRARPTSPFESVVVGQKERKEVSTVAISVGELTKIPGTSGDTVKVVQNLPGVARAPFGAGMLVIRGGNPSDTLTYIDGQIVPLVFHFGALRSVYASELVEEVQFEPGNFGARYGRATAGRVELITRKPEKKQLHLVADLDLFDGMAMIEGPISDKVHVAAGLRRSWVDAVINAATAASPDTFGDVGFAIAPRYYDWQAKIGYQHDAANDIRLDFYGSDDALALVGIDSGGVEESYGIETRTGFFRAGLIWDHRASEATRFRLQVTPGVDNLRFSADPLLFELKQTVVGSRAELYHDVSKSFSIGGGLDLLVSNVQVSTMLPRPPPRGQVPAPDFRQDLVAANLDLNVAQPGLWMEAIWSPVENLKLVPGIRFDADTFIDSAWIDPRFSARWGVVDGTTLKGGVGLYHRPPTAQFATVEFGNPNLKEEGAVQYMVGVEQRIHGPIHADVQLYYKDLFDLTVDSDRIVRRGGEDVPERYSNDGTGRAYGAEVLLRYNPDGRFFGWIAYSLSHTQRTGRPDSRSDGADPNDQPHNLVALGSLEVPEIWEGLSFGFRVRATSGTPQTRIGGAIYDVDADDYRSSPLDRVSSDRLPFFFQLDLRIDKTWTWDTSRFTAYLDLQNVTNHENVEGVNYNFDYTRRQYTPGLPFFPSFGLRFEY